MCRCVVCGNTRYVCNDCKRSHKHLKEFKRLKCSIKNLRSIADNECDNSQNHTLCLEDGSPDDYVDFSLNHSQFSEHDTSHQHDTNPHNNLVDEETVSVLNETHRAMTKVADNNHIIERTAWGNQSSMNYFLMENQTEHAGIKSVVSNATKRYELSTYDIDYHLLGTSLMNNLPRNKRHELVFFMKETLKRVKEKKQVILSDKDMRRVYIEGSKSIYQNLPVPLAMVGGEALGKFAIVSVENALNHLLGHGIPLKMLKFNTPSDWKDTNGCFHTLFHKELHEKLQKLDNVPENLRIHFVYIWSDGFQKNTLLKTKRSSLQFFTVTALPPDGVRDIARYTLPFALGKKQKNHHSLLIEVLEQTKGLEKVTLRFCKDSQSCEPIWFERVVIQNDQVERVNNLSILQGGTFGKRVGHSIEFDDERTPSCKRCFSNRFERLFPSDNNIPPSSDINPCEKCSDWWIDYGNINGWIQTPLGYPTVSCTEFGKAAPLPPKGREIKNEKHIAPCKLSFPFLLQAYEYAKFQYLRENGWSQAMTKVYLRTCCMSGDVSDKFFEMAFQVKQNNAPETIFTPPVLWLQHKELGIKIEHFADAPMHMLFLGVTKHLMAHVERVFGTRKAHYRSFCKIISTHINFGKDVSLEWCPIADFSDIESISTTGWQSAQYVSFSRLSLVYFGLLEDFKDVIDEKKIKTFRQVFVLWFLLISSLFSENCCNPDLVDDYVRLFLSSCVTYGMSTKTTTETHISKKSKRQKKRGEPAFFRDTSNYFSLLNLKSLIERFGSIRNLWEGEREKFIKYVKAEMNTIYDTETYMTGVLNSLLRTHCLHSFMKDNQYYQGKKMSKMRQFQIYKSRDAFYEDFSTGKMLSGVIVKSLDCDEIIYICYEEKEKKRFVFEEVRFNDINGCSRFKLYYSPLIFSKTNQDDEVFFVNSRNEVHERVSGYVIIHPMVTKNQKYKKSNGHTVLTHSWRIRTENGLCDFVPQSSDLYVFVED